MKFNLLSLGLCACTAWLGVAQPAQAQGSTARAETYQVRSSSKDQPSYDVTFIDDPLDALPSSSYVAQIRVRAGRVRSLLIRPRTSFVTEMLVSVQAL